MGGFRSHVFTADKVQEAAKRNGGCTDAMINIADKERKRSVSKGKHVEITSEAI